MKKMIDKKLFTENNDVMEFVVLGYGKTRSQYKKTTKDEGLKPSMNERYKKFCINVIGLPCTSLKLKSLRKLWCYEGKERRLTKDTTHIYLGYTGD